MSQNIRIKDIARMAGVSSGTVDRVLHNRGRVSEEALKRVMAVLEKIDYKPNLLARTLASSQILPLAAIIPRPDQDPYWAQSWNGILQARQDWAYYNVSIEPFLFDLYDKNSFKALARSVVAARPKGVLIAPIFYNEAIPLFDLLREAEIPYVNFNTHLPEAQPLSSIGQDLYQSGRVAAELMYMGFATSGINHFAVLHIAEDIHNSVHLAEKEKGFRDYLQEKDIENSRVTTLNLSQPNAPNFAKEITALVSREDLRGIMVSTSKSTYLVASVIEKQKPERLCLAGYDLLDENISFLKSGTIDFLIHQNPGRQARVGIGYLVNHLMFRKKLPLRDLFPLEIITRENLGSYLASETR